LERRAIQHLELSFVEIASLERWPTLAAADFGRAMIEGNFYTKGERRICWEEEAF
jgi:hypothetical protein